MCYTWATILCVRTIGFPPFSDTGFVSDFAGPPFAISEDELLLTGLLDFERVQSYLFNVTAVDGGMPVMFDEAQVEIIIIDVNDNSPEFVPRNYVADVNEGDYTLNFTVVVLVS